MKKTKMIAIIIALVLPALAAAACGKSEFGVTDNTGKLMTINAENAEENAYFMSGSIEVADGEQVKITANLKKGLVRVELFAAPKEQSAGKFPEIEGDPILMMNLHGSEGSSGTMPAGTYLVKATCLEKATGTIRVEVQPAE